MASAPVRPLVAIVGATGTGKSDLAVEIARMFNGEIINGDAMQLYQGLPVITNKISKSEMNGIPHHLLGCIGLEEETWTVGKFVHEALGVIDGIRNRGKLPILVGGTHYYTQSLLFHDALVEGPPSRPCEAQKRFPILDEPTPTILEELQKVDPLMAQRWHPNERRKIQRSLEIYLRTGKPASQIYEEQHSKQLMMHGAINAAVISPTGAPEGLRFPTVLFWVHASKDILYPRLDARVAKMLDRGLLAEVDTLTSFRSSYEKRTGKAIDQSRGIWVSIGYKEFLGYQAARKEHSLADPVVEKLKAAAVEKTQAATRQYAKRQLRWIRIKLLNALYNSGQRNIFLVDCSDTSKWQEQVIQPASDITRDFLGGCALPDPSGLSETARTLLNPQRDYDLGQRPDLWQKKICDACGTVAVTENDWKLHVHSRSHRKAVGIRKRQEKIQQSSCSDTKTLQTDVGGMAESRLRSFPGDKT